METVFPDVSVKTGVRIAGFSLLAMFIVAVFDPLFFSSSLILWNDAAQTFHNLRNSAMQYRMHVFFFLLIFLLDIVVAFGLYLLLRPVNKSLSLLGAWFRVLYAAAMVAVTVHQLDVLHLVGEAGYLSAYEPAQLQAMVMTSLHAYASGFSYALIFFSFHILLVGYLVYQSGYMPKLLGIALLVAMSGYLIDGLANLLFPEFRAQHQAWLEGYLGVVGIIGELYLALYLVIRGKKIAEAIERKLHMPT